MSYCNQTSVSKTICCTSQILRPMRLSASRSASGFSNDVLQPTPKVFLISSHIGSDEHIVSSHIGSGCSPLLLAHNAHFDVRFVGVLLAVSGFTCGPSWRQWCTYNRMALPLVSFSTYKLDATFSSVSQTGTKKKGTNGLQDLKIRFGIPDDPNVQAHRYVTRRRVDRPFT